MTLRFELVPLVLVLLLLIHSSECFRLHRLPPPHTSVLRLAAAASKVEDDKNEGKQYNERPIQKLQRTFEASMIDPKVPLLRDFDTYANTLPTRSYGEADYHMRLADCHFYARDEQFELMISQIQDHRETGDRCIIAYISSRSCSGKSASVLNLFLHCVENGSFGTRKVQHYFHMTFHNNNGNTFKYTGIVSAIDRIAYNQGAAFIFEAIKKLVELPGDYSSIEVQDSPLEQKETRELLRAYIHETFPVKNYILVHIDEHAKLCERSEFFRRGAWQTLAEVKRFIVLASYTQLPDELNPVTQDESSEVCAGPVTAVLVDLLSMVKHMPELAGFRCILTVGNDRKKERLLSTFRFRLAFWLLERKRLSRIQGLMFLRDNSISLSKDEKEEILFASSKIKQEIEAVAKFAEQGDIVKASNLCKPRLGKNRAMLDHAAALLIGIDPKNVRPKGHIKVESGIVLPNGMISTHIVILLNAEVETSAPSAGVFESSCRRLRSILAKDLSGDILSDSPLEAVYAWVLGVEAATTGILRLTSDPLLFQCKDIRAGRILKTDDTSSFSPGKLADGTSIQKYVLYYVDEDGDTGDRNTHPAADLFFLTDCGTKLVLIEVTGGKYKAASKRKRRLQSFIDLYKEQCKVRGVDLNCIGFVLAPLAEDESGGAGKATDVNTLYNEDARNLMGAFAQYSELFVDSGVVDSFEQ